MPPRIGSRSGQSYRRHFIRAWRENAGLSLDRLLERIPHDVEGFSKTSLSRIETFQQPYSEPILAAIADALGCEPADLLRAPDSKAWNLAETLSHLDDAALDQITEIAKTFRKRA